MGISLFTALNQGLMWGILALGVYISFRMLDFADLTCEGAIVTGEAVAAEMIIKGINPLLAVIAAFLAGGVAGAVTGILNTKLKIPPILSGILTLTGIYSVNLRIMGANVSLLNQTTLMTWLVKILNVGGISYSLSWQIANFIVAFTFVIIAITALYWFFGTELGCAVRATGNNSKMCRAQGINTDRTTIIGLIISNALIALSGALTAQMQSNANIQLGPGAIVIGLASIVIGESVTGQHWNFILKFTMIIVGSIAYKFIITLILMIPGFNTNDLKIVTAIIVTVALSIPALKQFYFKSVKPLFQSKSEDKN